MYKHTFHRFDFLAKLFAIAVRLVVIAVLLLAGAGPLPVQAQDETPPAPETGNTAPEMNASGPVTDTSSPVMDAITPLDGQLLVGVIQIAAGGNFTCALTRAGSVFCWGFNSIGQLGNGTFTSSSIPVPVSGLGKGVNAITAGTFHACAVLDSGEVRCWGSNNHYQLGDGSNSNRNTPVTVQKLEGAIAIAAGDGHSCAVLSSGAVVCWGDNSYGQLGDNSEKNSLVPVAVLYLTDKVKSVTAGLNHTCAVLYSGGMQCWGYNIYGQLGDGTTTNRLAPGREINLAAGASSAGAGEFHTCAVLTTGGVQCWGRNNYGQVGDGTTTDRWVPVSVNLGLGALASRIELGNSHTCVVIGKLGGIKCWGLNSSYQLGDGTSFPRSSPVSVIGLAGPVSVVSGGASHTCAVISSDGTVQCWGSNSAFQLGSGYQSKYNQPIQVPGLKSEFVEAGNGAACAIDTAGAAYCWGSNTSGKLGDGTTADRHTPTPVTGITDDVLDIQYGADHACALTTDPLYPVKCWGRNVEGQLGDGTNTTSPTPVNVEKLGGSVSAIAVGGYHTCALLADGTVWCWGYNKYGQLGDKSNIDSATPVQVQSLLGNVLQIAAGGNHTCAVTNSVDIPIQCWGYNASGQLGNNSQVDSYLPVNVYKLSGTILNLTAGYTHTCAVLSDNSVACWGSDSYGELGDGGSVLQIVPVYLTITGVEKITGGQNHTCALMSDQTLQCWGKNDYGQLGDGTYTSPRRTPVAVTRLDDGVTQVSAGYNSTCAAQAGGLIYCWGNNIQGQMGLGSGATSHYPDWVLAPLDLDSITPTSGMNDMPVRVTLKGSGFQESSIVRLVSGTTVVELDDVYLVDGNTLTASVPAAEPGIDPQTVPAGLYDVTLIAPSGNTAVLSRAYEVLDYRTYNDLYAYTFDFVVGTASKLSKSVYAGQTAQLSLVVRRLGTVPDTTPVFNVTFYAVNPTVVQNPTPIGQVRMTYGLGPNKMARTPPLNWMPTRAGVIYLYAKIDSGGTNTWGEVQEIPSANENNNVVSRMVRVLPAIDTTPPLVNGVTIKDSLGNILVFSSSQKVRITTTASDTGSGVAYLLFTEYVFVQSRGNWEPVQKTGWLPYSTSATNFPWAIDPTPGVHYIKVWAADKAGNISLNSGMSFVNYMPERDYLAAGEYRVFHQYLTAGDRVSLYLTRYYGSALLYVWSPDLLHNVSVQNPAVPYYYSAQVSGVHQYEVEGVRPLRLLFGGTSYHFSAVIGKGFPLSGGDPSLMGRVLPGSAMVPADEDAGVDSAPAPDVYLPILMR